MNKPNSTNGNVQVNSSTSGHYNNSALNKTKKHHQPQSTKSLKKRSTINSHHPVPHHHHTKQTMYTPPAPHPMVQIHSHCTPPPPPPAHVATIQETPHAYLPNGEIYFPGHYLDHPQTMVPPHMNQAPAYFMAGMKENTFHQ